jgi:hypothetical protein
MPHRGLDPCRSGAHWLPGCRSVAWSCTHSVDPDPTASVVGVAEADGRRERALSTDFRTCSAHEAAIGGLQQGASMHPRACVLDRNRALIQPMEHSPTRLQGNPGLCLRRALVATPRNLHSVHNNEYVRAVATNLISTSLPSAFMSCLLLRINPELSAGRECYSFHRHQHHAIERSIYGLRSNLRSLALGGLYTGAQSKMVLPLLPQSALPQQAAQSR